MAVIDALQPTKNDDTWGGVRWSKEGWGGMWGGGRGSWRSGGHKQPNGGDRVKIKTTSGGGGRGGR